MTQDQAEQLYILTNTPQWKDFVAYKQERLEEVHKQMEYAGDDAFRKLQGEATEIRSSLTLHRRVSDFLGLG